MKNETTKNTGKKNSTRVMVIGILLVMAVVAYYCYLVNKTQHSDDSGDVRAAQQVLSRSMELDYPPSPKEVMKYYNEIMKCFYNEECTDEEITQLGERARELYDEELAAQNDWDTYIEQLRAEIEGFHKNNRRISSFSVAASTDVDYYERDGYSFARIRCAYNILEGKISTPVNEVYLLRQDAQGHWKIYGWDLASNLENNQ